MYQFIRYAAVGVLNTLITFAVIFVCKNFLGVNPWVSNAAGYVAGFVNSFVWNKLWVFKAQGNVLPQVIRFVGGFLACYALQFAATWCMLNLTPLRLWALPLGNWYTVSGYAVATLFGMAVYTLANFFYNRIITFKD